MSNSQITGLNIDFGALASKALSEKTPIRLRLLLFVIAVACLIWAIASFGCTAQHYSTVKTIGRDAAPSVVAAHKIKIGVETMDADVANILLAPPDPNYKNSVWMSDFNSNRQFVASNLVAAAKNITYGEAETVPISQMEDSLGIWLMEIQRAIDCHNANRPGDAAAAYNQSLHILQDQLMPAADALNKANSDILESTYDSQRSANSLAILAVGMMGFVTTGSLIYTQWYLTRRFRRKVNPYLLVASMLAALFAVWSVLAYLNCREHVRATKEDAYNSVVALLDARSDSFDGNAAESRWLFDVDHRSAHEKLFFDKADKIAKLEPGTTFEQVAAHAMTEYKRIDQSVIHKPVTVTGMTGAIGTELNNITFPGEYKLALDMLKRFALYYGLDAKIRSLEHSGNHAEAVRFCLSYKPGESNWAFVEYDKALDKVLNLNQSYLEHYIKAAFADLIGLQTLAIIIPLIIAILATVGIRPRLAEYMSS